MDCQEYITVSAERKRGQHLGPEERGAIKALAKQGLGVGAIARNIGCAPSTIHYELRRGTPARKSSKGKARATLQNLRRRSIKSTEWSAASLSRLPPARSSSLGRSNRSVSTSGL